MLDMLLILEGIFIVFFFLLYFFNVLGFLSETMGAVMN